MIGRGYYQGGKKLGSWEYFDDGQLALKFDHTLDSILFEIPQNYEYEIIGIGLRKLTKAPQYPGFSHVVYENLVYPMHALKMGVAGQVFISFVVNEDGTTRDYKILKDVGLGCGKELVKALMVMNTGWLPGELNGKKVPVKIQVFGNFQLLDDGEKRIVVKRF